jgi:hypothetical protein
VPPAAPAEWTAWQTLNDGQRNGIDISFKHLRDDMGTGTHTVYYRARSRYPVTVSVEVHIALVGASHAVERAIFHLKPGAIDQSGGNWTVARDVGAATVVRFAVGESLYPPRSAAARAVPAPCLDFTPSSPCAPRPGDSATVPQPQTSHDVGRPETPVRPSPSPSPAPSPSPSPTSPPKRAWSWGYVNASVLVFRPNAAPLRVKVTSEPLAYCEGEHSPAEIAESAALRVRLDLAPRYGRNLSITRIHVDAPYASREQAERARRRTTESAGWDAHASTIYDFTAYSSRCR